MLTKKQILEIREHLEKAQNPLFFFDNDPDGLCSYLLLRRYIRRGKGIAIKSFPDMNAEYFQKARELNSDYIFILDKPVVSNSFFEEARKFNIPVVWIDHHKIEGMKVPDFIYYYNPAFKNPKKNEPVTYLCYQIANQKSDLWLGIAGCISDRFVPGFYKEFMKLYPDLSIKSQDAFEIFYKSQIGVIARMFSFSLKDRISNVVKMTKFLSEVKTPYEVLEESGKNKEMHIKFKQISKKAEKFIEKAKSLADENKFLFFQYSGDLSISADLSNELTYLFPNKIIAVIYTAGAKANISVRGKKIKNLVLKSIKNLNDATGGGHEDAVGARIKIEDIEQFKENMQKFS
ncbi:DHHA1 domain protein [uncultured archaeon]|nr:DHHA1 domain protein [uncultured archaeon]